MSESPIEDYFNIVKIILDECSIDKDLKTILVKYMKEYGVNQEILSAYIPT